VSYAGRTLIATKTIMLGQPTANPALDGLTINSQPPGDELTVGKLVKVPLSIDANDVDFDVTWLTSCGTMSPPASEGTISTGITGDQGTTLEEEGTGWSAGIGRRPNSRGSSVRALRREPSPPTLRRRNLATGLTAVAGRAEPRRQARRVHVDHREPGTRRC
jgi:hypothetical protein